jgi:hypothetical protein
VAGSHSLSNDAIKELLRIVPYQKTEIAFEIGSGGLVLAKVLENMVGTVVCTEIKEVFDQYRAIMEPQLVPTLRNTNQKKGLALKAVLKRKLEINSEDKMVKQLSVVENSQSEEQFHLLKKRVQNENEVNMN